jgi:membrane fusion protein (multidrug efflux system)
MAQVEEQQPGVRSPASPPPGREQNRPPEQRPEEKRREPVRERASRFFFARPAMLLLFIFVLAILAAGGFYLWGYLNSYESTDDAQIDGHLNPISTRIAGTVKAVYVEENQVVKAGQVLVEIDPADYQVAVERARAEVAQAQAQVQAQAPNVPLTTVTTATTAATSAADVAEASAGVAAAESQHQSSIADLREAEANNVKAQADVARFQALVQKDEVSRQQYDQAVAAAKAAAAKVEAARADVSAAEQTIGQRRAQLLQAQSRAREATATAPQQIAIQRANVASRNASTQAAQAALNQAALNLSYTKIVAPVDGIVGRKMAEVGTQVNPGQQLLSVVQTGDIWVTANYKETQLRHMRPGQRATIKVDALDRSFNGYVDSIAGASGARYSLLPPENATGNFVKVVQRVPVRLRFDKGQQDLERLRPGLSVTSKVWLK